MGRPTFGPASGDQVKVDRAGLTSLRLASGAREFAGLKAFFAEHRAPLCWLERHRRFLAAVRTCGDRFNPFAGTATRAAGRPRSAFGLARFAALRFVLEILVGEELLFSRRPDELRATVYAPEQPVLELHWSLPRRVGLRVATPTLAGVSYDYACAPAPAWRDV